MAFVFIHLFIFSLIISLLGENNQINGEFDAHERNKYKAEYNINEIDEKNYNKFKKYFDKYYQAQKEQEEYQLDNDLPCDCFIDNIESDLRRWNHSGITENLIDRGKKTRGIHYQIINHKLYRHKDCLFPSRCEGNEHFINKIINDLPDIELVINVHDYPQVLSVLDSIPVFSFSRDNNYQDILYPAWAFWCGGPAIDLYPTGIGRWDLMRDFIVKHSQKWETKESIAFFRGSRTSADRDPLIHLSLNKPDLVEAQYTKNQAWRSKADTLGFDPAPTVSFEEQCKYKYLFNLRGVAASFRYKHLFLCKSVVLNVNSDWTEFFYNKLKPWIHYVPIAEDFKDAEEIISFLQENDQIANKIALNGFNFIWKHLTLEAVECYWKNLLLKYSQLFGYKVKHDKTLILIENKYSNK